MNVVQQLSNWKQKYKKMQGICYIKKKEDWLRGQKRKGIK